MNEHELDKSAEALNETEVSAPVAEEVETDALTTALDSLAKAMNKDSYAKADSAEDEDMEKGAKSDDMESEEMKAEDMDSEDKADDKAEDAEGDDEEFIDLEEAMKAMADHTDRLVSDMNERLDALLQGVEAMLVEMKNMKAEQGNMSKSLNAVVEAPMPPRAVTSAPVVSAPVAPTATRGDMISKALTKLQDPQTDASTRYRLRTTIAQLEAGAPLTQFSDLG
jgi:hypothetical protein